MNEDETSYIGFLLMGLVDKGLLTYDEARRVIDLYMEETADHENKKKANGTAAA